MSNSSTSSTKWFRRDLNLVIFGSVISAILGAVCGVYGTLYVNKRNEPKEAMQATIDSLRNVIAMTKLDTTNKHLGSTVNQLGEILTELQSQSGQMTTQTESFTTSLTDLASALRKPTIDTSYTNNIIAGLNSKVQELSSSSRSINANVDKSHALLSIYDIQFKNDVDLTHLLLPRSQTGTRAMPIDSKYFVGVRGQYGATDQQCVYASIDGRSKPMCSGDTAMIYANNSQIKVTFESVEDKFYVFGVNHVK